MKFFEGLDIRLAMLMRYGSLSLPLDRAPNPKDSDIHLVSFPKSGNTWFRYLLAYSLWPELDSIDLVRMSRYVPSVNLLQDIREMLNPDAPCNQREFRVIKNHAAYAPELRVRRAIYIVRDGRDAIVSYWHFCNQRDRTKLSLAEFMSKSNEYGQWREHVLSWLHAPLEDMLVIRYEDLIDDTAACLKEALAFCGAEVDNAVVGEAISKSSFDSLSKLEQTKGLNLEQLENVKFFRKGKVGSWESEFAQGDLERFNRFHGGPIAELGYEW